mgnify:CR=1 FL=1
MIQANDEAAVVRQLQTMLRSIQIARGETVVQAAAAHGVSADEMLRRLNEFNDASKK